MENASKALLIAGEVLIAILIIGILVYGYNNLSYFSDEQEMSQEIKQLTVFNREYESYNRKLLRGVEVISLMNKAISNNEKYKDNLGYYGVDITFEMVEAVSYTKEDIKENRFK